MFTSGRLREPAERVEGAYNIYPFGTRPPNIEQKDMFLPLINLASIEPRLHAEKAPQWKDRS